MPLSFTTFREKEREQMPREKMHQYGASALQMWELIAILMRTGERRGGSSEDVEQLSKRLLSEGGLRGLFTEVNPSKIMANFGTYKSHAETIAATADGSSSAATTTTTTTTTMMTTTTTATFTCLSSGGACFDAHAPSTHNNSTTLTQ